MSVRFHQHGFHLLARAAAGVHTTYLWHMHQPIYWPTESTWTPDRYETAYETITLGHSQNNVRDIFNKDDRVADYQWYPRDAIASVLDLPDAGAHAHPGEDVFLMLGATESRATAAPWAKVGQAVPWLRFLVRESGNGWTGWLDGSESVLDSPALSYATNDGGSLLHQSPAGNQDGNLDPFEQVVMPLSVTGVPPRYQGRGPVQRRVFRARRSGGGSVAIRRVSLVKGRR